MAMRTLRALFDHTVNAHPTRDYAVCYDSTTKGAGQRISFAELGQSVATLSQAISDIDGPIAIHLGDSPDWITVFFAIVSAKRPAVILDPRLDERFLLNQLADVRPHLIVTSPNVKPAI